MSIEIRADYTKQFLLPPSLEEWIPNDHPARFIRDFVDSLDLAGLGFRIPEASEGRPPYSADLQLKVWLYGYLEKIRSSRGLEKACYNQLPLIWLTGRNYPDHNTLWRFFKNNKKALRRIFRQIVGVAYDSGLIGLVVHAVDGTKIRACSSNRSGHHRNELETLLQELDAFIDEAMGEIESAEVSESGAYRLPKKLADAEVRRAQIKRSLAKLSEIDHDHYHPGESDTRMMKMVEGVNFGYNAQAVVDSQSSLIVAEEVTNSGSDNDQLVEMVEKAEENVGGTASETVADGGYYSPGQLAEAEERGYGVLVPILDRSSRQGRFHRSHFKYDESRDEYICPEGHCLKYVRTYRDRRQRHQIRVYRCQSFKDCPHRRQCSSHKRGRTLHRGEHDAAVSRQREKQKSVSKQEILTWRKWIVEPVFAHIKEHMNFRRWTMRNLENVRTQWSMICIIYNLKKLYRHWLEGTIILTR